MGSKAVVRESEGQMVLLVEGKDDEHVFYHLLEHHNIPEQFKIKNKEGIERLLDTLDVEVERSGLKRLGIVVDADMDLAARWQSLRNILIGLGYNLIPSEPDPNGTIIRQDRRPAIGVWLMPDNKLPGMIEDFISFLGPQNDVLWPIAQDVVQKVIETKCNFRPSYNSKAHLHTWLAWQEEPGSPMGLAITKRYLDADALHAHQLMSWIRQLFELEPG